MKEEFDFQTMLGREGGEVHINKNILITKCLY